MSINDAEFDRKATEFVEDYADEDISEIIAGVMQILNENEQTYDSIMKQKWFERIWKGLTGQNKSSIEEMNQKKDQLQKYLVRILVKMNEIVSKQGKYIHDLYYAVYSCNERNNAIVSELMCLAKVVESNKKYQNLIHDIRNKKRYPAVTPIISLIRVFAEIDYGVVRIKGDMNRIKETLEEGGFEFENETSYELYSQSLFDERASAEWIPKALLFCEFVIQNSNKPLKIVSYTCNILSLYYYSNRTDRKVIAEQRSESQRKELEKLELKFESKIRFIDLFSDLEEALKDSYENAQQKNNKNGYDNILKQNEPISLTSSISDEKVCKDEKTSDQMIDSVDLNTILKMATDNELMPIVRLLCNKNSCSITMDPIYKKHPNQPHLYLPLLENELSWMGGNDFANRKRGKGVGYHEIVCDVADQLNVNYNKKASSTATIEKYIVQKVWRKIWEKASDRQEQFINEAFLNEGKNDAIALSAKAIYNMMPYTISLIVAETVVGGYFSNGAAIVGKSMLPSSWGQLFLPFNLTMTKFWTSLNPFGTAYTATIPCVLYIASIRARIRKEK